MTSRAPRVRLDEYLVQRGQAPSREKARALILAGRVTVGGSDQVKPGLLIRPDLPVAVAEAQEYVSRGGIKLASGLERFGIDPASKICADVGASTGGFTDCLLQRGAARVYAIDVGYGQLDWKLRTDPRVVVMERTNARYLESLPDPIDLIVVDASFISLQTLFPAVGRIARPLSPTLTHEGGGDWSGAEVVALIKPQFEAGRGRVGKGGVVRDPAVHRDVLIAFAAWIEAAGHSLINLAPSPIRGPAGNVEFLAQVRLGLGGPPGEAGLIDRALAEAAELA
jgi:23S rRNA (cytidine1920-2'-O)/16S rRNA (cytidine1409-2'-O)-methyltransferase